ncbi:collagen alpha-1(XII) chain-like [Actinia tenebrosa]|uniref:Collagen alpha-1(XII) chain-like n=1 Tax=Actinia tenebrosa TaxID=6105 RepID=A0A6P8IKC8_ACTTE|nr:collagen alpha-1(XII) chain-like [Actinia tenebrosa]
MSAAVRGTMFGLLLIFFILTASNSILNAAPVKDNVCSKPMDIAFIMDVSGSIGRKGLKTMKGYAKMVVDHFGMSDQGNHYAIMTFAKDPRILVDFNTFTGSTAKSANLKFKIHQMHRIDWNGGSFIDKALLAANSTLFTVGAGMRQNALKAAIIMTDGIQTKHRGPFTSPYKAARGLQTKGVQLIAAGIGTAVDVIELMDITGKMENVFSVGRLPEPANLELIARTLCSKPTAVPTTSTPLK